MNVDNFVVRPHRRLVERFREPEAWATLDVGDLSELANDVAGLPAELDAEPEEAKRFDLLLLSTELALLRTEPGFPRLQEQVRQIAGLLEEYPTIPAVAQRAAADRRRADRRVVGRRHAADARGGAPTPAAARAVHREGASARSSTPTSRTRSARAPRSTSAGWRQPTSSNGSAARPARSSPSTRPTSPSRRSTATGRSPPTTSPSCNGSSSTAASAPTTTCERAVEEAGSLGLFIRRLVGLDRAAAKEAFAEFLDDKRYTANQIEFVNLVIDELTEHGVVEPRRFYESPFTDLSPHGPDALFESDVVDRLVAAVDRVRQQRQRGLTSSPSG